MMTKLAAEEGYGDSHYTRPHWASATTETLDLWIEDLKETVVPLWIANQLNVNGLLP